MKGVFLLSNINGKGSLLTFHLCSHRPRDWGRVYKLKFISLRGPFLSAKGSFFLGGGLLINLFSLRGPSFLNAKGSFFVQIHYFLFSLRFF